MKHAKILESSDWVFDWRKGKEAMDKVANDDGSFNLMAASAADPGASKCPGCGEFYWAEAEHLECIDPECGVKWNTNTKEVIDGKTAN